MTISATAANDQTEMTITVDGRFDFSSHQEFRQVYENAPKSVKRWVVDMSSATYLDSSALGMLLLLRDHAGGESSDITITGCNNDVRKILTISNFGQLFNID